MRPRGLERAPVVSADDLRVFRCEADGDPSTRCVAAARQWNLHPVHVIGGGALSLCTLCIDITGKFHVLKAGAVRQFIVAEATALRIWHGRAPMPAPTPVHPQQSSHEMALAELEEVRELGAHTMALATGDPPRTLTNSPRLTSPYQRDRLTDALCAAWLAWCVPASALSRDAGFEHLDHQSAAIRRRADWATRRSRGRRRHRQQIAAAVSLADDMTKTSRSHALCHGDLSPRNLLDDGVKVTVLDPLPHIGDPVSDLGHWAALSAVEADGSDIETTVTRIAHSVGNALTDLSRLHNWTLIAMALEANLAPTDNGPCAQWLDSYLAPGDRLEGAWPHPREGAADDLLT